MLVVPEVIGFHAVPFQRRTFPPFPTTTMLSALVPQVEVSVPVYVIGLRDHVVPSNRRIVPLPPTTITSDDDVPHTSRSSSATPDGICVHAEPFQWLISPE